MSSADIPSDADLVNILLRLHGRGYRVDARQSVDALAVLAALRYEGRDLDSAAIAASITPIVAKSPDQQEDLRSLLARWLSEGRRMTTPQSNDGLVLITPELKTKVMWLGVMVVVLLFVVVILSAILSPPHYWTALRTNFEAAVSITLAPASNGVDGRKSLLFTLLLITISIASYILISEGIGRRGRSRTALAGSEDLLDFGSVPFTAWLYTRGEVSEVALKLRDCRHVRVREYDDKATIDATILNGGLFTPIRKAEPLSPVYGVMCQEESRHDHLAKLTDNLCLALTREGVNLEQAYYRAGVFRADGLSGAYSSRRFDEFKRRPEGSLLVFGDGSALTLPLRGSIDPAVQQQTSDWTRRYFLSTRPIAEWGSSEQALLEDGWSLATARLSGIKVVAEHLAIQDQPPDLLEGRKVALPVDGAESSDPAGEVAVGVPALLSLIARMHENAMSRQLAAELGSVSQLISAGKLASAFQRLRVLETVGLVTPTPSIAAAHQLNSDKLLVDDPARLMQLRAFYDDLARLSNSEVREIAAALRAYRVLMQLPRYSVDYHFLSGFDARLGRPDARLAPIADLALAAVTGAIFADTVPELFERTLRTSFSDARSPEPFERILLQNGQRFFGRTQLRQFARHASESTSTRALFCLGGAGSGKTKSGAFIDDISIDVGSFEVVQLLTDAIHLAATEELLARITETSSARRALDLLAVFAEPRVGRNVAASATTVVFIEDVERLSPEAQARLGGMIADSRSITSPVRFVITGETRTLPNPRLLSATVARFTQAEYLSLGSSALDPEGAIIEVWLAHHHRRDTIR